MARGASALRPSPFPRSRCVRFGAWRSAEVCAPREGVLASGGCGCFGVDPSRCRRLRVSCLPCVHAPQVCGISDGHWGMLVPKVWTWTPGPPWVCGFLGSVHTGSWVCAGHLFTLGMTPTGELPNHRLCRCGKKTLDDSWASQLLPER